MKQKENSIRKTGKSLAFRMMRTTVMSCVIMALIAMAIGLSIYGSTLARHSISRAYGIADGASLNVKRGQPGARDFAAQVMDIYGSLTPAQQLKMISDDPKEREEYRANFSAIDISPHGTIYSVLSHMLLGFKNDVDYVYLGMYDRENNRLIYIVDPDENEENRMYPGDWEYVPADEAHGFLDWNGEGMLYHISRTKEDGWLCTAGHPVQYEEGTTDFFFLADVKLSSVIAGMVEYALKVGLPLLLATALLAWLISRHVRRTVAGPINAIAGAAQAYVQDRRAGVPVTDHFSPLNIRTGDELENLSHTMADMEQQLAHHEEQITRITMEKERINTELTMASRIQSSMLPNTFPAFPDRNEFDIYAVMDPAKEIGGDFYDFFMIDQDHLGIVMADVSGKGVPAALYMMITKFIIQNCAMLREPPGKIFADTNTALCGNNRMEMFVTAWVGVLEISTGRMMTSSAGHEYPAVFRAAGGSFELLRGRQGFVLGGMENMTYKEYEIQLHKGDKLFLYTDGVPEATGADKEMFGLERMLASLNRTGTAAPRETLMMVRADVDAFVGDAEQFDDLTMLCLEYKGSKEA